MYLHFISTMTLLVISPILLWIGNKKDNDAVWAASIVSLVIGEILAVMFLTFR